MKHVLIIGGGFAGLNAAKGLGNVEGVAVTLIDKHNYHLVLKIGQVAERCEISRDTIRHYEKLGLLPTVQRTASGYRIYKDDVVEQVRFVRRALRFGFSLTELSGFVKARENGTPPCRSVRAVAARILGEVEQQIVELTAARDAIRTTLSEWDERLNSALPGTAARLLESITGDGRPPLPAKAPKNRNARRKLGIDPGIDSRLYAIQMMNKPILTSTLFLLFAAAGSLGAQDHPSMPPGMTHEEHLKEMKLRGAMAMGFDQDTTTHHFRLFADGGAIEVGIKNPADLTVRQEVRTHLKEIREDFSRGVFDKPLITHSEVPPGVPVMQKLKSRISYAYTETANGATVRIKTKDSQALAAIHEFLRYQIGEHQTGDPAKVQP